MQPDTNAIDLHDCLASDFIEQMKDAVMVVDLYGKIVACNEALCDRVGYPRAELIGASPAIWHHDQEAYGELTREIISSTLENGSWLGMIGFASTSGEERLSEVLTTPFRDRDGRIVAILSVSRDVSARTHRLRRFPQSP
jgi:PAS domain S-box-containing protein